MEVSKKARGGYRANAGTKSKYGEQTENITFRVPASHKQAIREIVKKYLMNIIQQQHNDKVNDNTLRHRIGGNEAR
jgi:hypothetical protein